jgi:hypothetical protein
VQILIEVHAYRLRTDGATRLLQIVCARFPARPSTVPAARPWLRRAFAAGRNLLISSRQVTLGFPAVPDGPPSPSSVE